MPFTLATWNINSVRLREGLVAKLMAEEAPDVLCLQECKSPVDLIPVEAFRALGYTHMVARGQKGYNGVAILSKLPLEDAGGHDLIGMGHARHVAARLENGVTIHNYYIPAGGDEPDRAVNEKFGQKLDVLVEMRDRFPLRGRRHHFFESRSFRPALSSIVSASRRLSLPLSSSSDRSRFASDTSRPPNLAFHA